MSGTVRERDGFRAIKDRTIECDVCLALAGNASQAEWLTRELTRRFSLDTQVQTIWIPAIEAQLDLDRNNPIAALKALQRVTGPEEWGIVAFGANVSGSCLYPSFIRGEAYLAADQGTAAAAEFQKILDHRGIAWNCWTGSLAQLGVARANALQAKNSAGAESDAARVRAVTAYRDFLNRWKNADANIPILKQAKAEFAKLL